MGAVFLGVRSLLRVTRLALVSLFAVVAFGCSGKVDRVGEVGSDVDLVALRAGKLVDVYGLRKVDGVHLPELVERDVLIGADIADERPPGSRKVDSEIFYDFQQADAASLQPRLLITREITSAEFARAFARLGRTVQAIEPREYAGIEAAPFSPVPRNAAIELVFDRDLGLDEDFFIDRDEQGRVRGIRNPRAIELLEIVADPRDDSHRGDFRPIPVRIAYKGNRIVLDPVLLASEGPVYGMPNSASGLPQSPDSHRANLRVAVALEGQLRLRGLRRNGIKGRNNEGLLSLIRDFRSGNANDSSQYLHNGYLRDSAPPRIAGRLPMRLSRVDTSRPQEHRIVVYKEGLSHGLDAGDQISLYADGDLVATTEIVVDPIDDATDKTLQHVVVRVRDARAFADHDPSKRPDYPTKLSEREAWLRTHGPRLVVATEFDAGAGDELVNFVAVSPEPLPDPKAELVVRNRNVSPLASMLLRFTQPVDFDSVRPFDSLVFATSTDPAIVFDAKKGRRTLVAAEARDEDGSQTQFWVSPVLGFYLDDEMRDEAKRERFAYALHVVGGKQGIKSLSGIPLELGDLGKRKIPAVTMPFWLDTHKDALGRRRFANNRVVSIVHRFASSDEDPGPDRDVYGAVSFEQGRMYGRPTSRQRSWVDDRNQLPSPPRPPLAFCPSGTTSTLTGATVFGQPIQTPLNPHGSRTMTIWREIDLSLSRTTPYDMDLDVERIWWAPFQGAPDARPTIYDVYDRTSLWLAHSERRPSPCVSVPWSLPVYEESGLRYEFWHNVARDRSPKARAWNEKSEVTARPDPVVAYRDQQLVVRPRDTIFEPSGARRFLPLPEFAKPYFRFRDQRLTVLGGGQGEPQVLSPFKSGTWNNANWTAQEDGRVGSIALPLLADFHVHPDDPDLPIDDPFLASGVNGWQVSLALTSQRFARQNDPVPKWRVYSSGWRDTTRNERVTVDPSAERVARGGWDPTLKQRTPPGDPVVYWAAFDWLKRSSVATFGFVPVENPHAADDGDPRHGPFGVPSFEGVRIEYGVHPRQQPAGTKALLEFRVAGAGIAPSFAAFDPLVAGDAHVRNIDSSNSRWERYAHTRQLSPWTKNSERLSDASWLQASDLEPSTVRNLNYRVLFENSDDPQRRERPRLEDLYLVWRLPSR